MLIWSGKGILVPLIFVFSFTLTVVASDLVSLDTGWQSSLLMLLAGLFIYLLSRFIDKDKGKLLIDPESGEEVLLKDSHGFFFIPVKYWAYMSVILGVWFSIQRVFDL